MKALLAQLPRTWAGVENNLLVAEGLHQIHSPLASSPVAQPYNWGFVIPLGFQSQGWRTLHIACVSAWSYLPSAVSGCHKHAVKSSSGANEAPTGGTGLAPDGGGCSTPVGWQNSFSGWEKACCGERRRGLRWRMGLAVKPMNLGLTSGCSTQHGSAVLTTCKIAGRGWSSPIAGP